MRLSKPGLPSMGRGLRMAGFTFGWGVRLRLPGPILTLAGPMITWRPGGPAAGGSRSGPTYYLPYGPYGRPASRLAGSRAPHRWVKAYAWLGQGLCLSGSKSTLGWLKAYVCLGRSLRLAGSRPPIGWVKACVWLGPSLRLTGSWPTLGRV